jgi:imidazolonepropionase-like amidohydrolase
MIQAAGCLLLLAALLVRDGEEPEPREGARHAFELDAQREPELVTGGDCLITGVAIHSAVGPPSVGDVLVVDGDIAAIGQGLAAPPGAVAIDGSGKHLAPGVVDCHSHMAIEQGVNEGTLSITAEVDISDALNADDIAIYRALAGGATTARLLHGSANTIGGRHEVIKLKWKRTGEELRFPGAREGIKFALGENVKRSNGGGDQTRYPATRMGVESIFYRAFTRAGEYRDEWAAYAAARESGGDPAPPRRDLRLETLVGILDGTVDVHSHCYRADEILMLLRAAEHYGFRVKTLQHVLEGYKVAKEIVEHGAGPSTFSDWWAYKVEAYDATPFNGALLDRAGALTSFNSDSDEMVRHLYAEAAKAVHYGGLDPVRALRLVTLNPARQLGIDDRVGSIEVGKDADLVLLDGEPLSALSKVLLTLVDGEVEFQRRDAFGFDQGRTPVAPLAEPEGEQASGWSLDGGEVVAITGATLHPITSPVIENGTLLIQDGRIAAMGPQAELPSGARILPANGKHVWPGIFALDTSLGLQEIDSVRATLDRNEIGGNQPDIRVSAALNAESAHIPVARYNGVTRAQVSPAGRGPLRGQSCVIRLAGDTWEELLTLDRDMLHLVFPRTADDAEDKEYASDEVEELRDLFEDAREYARVLSEAEAAQGRRPAFDPRLETLAPFARGERPVAVHANNAQTILYALRFVEEQGLKALLYGARDGWKVAPEIAASGVGVVIGPVLALPASEFDPYDAPFANAAVLHRAGIPFAIAGNGEDPRNLVQHAATACAFGLPREEALRAITFYPARAVGLERELGSLAVGKRADVIVTDGDLLELTTHVEAVFVDGRQMSLETRHTRFYDYYLDRLERLDGGGSGD